LASQPIEVVPGHSVVANPGGAARVTFPDGCTVDVRPGSVFTVAAQSPCQRASHHVETGASLKDARVETSEERWSPVPIIAGVATIGVGALLLRDKGKGASP
jgi:hypothetical protein